MWDQNPSIQNNGTQIRQLWVIQIKELSMPNPMDTKCEDISSDFMDPKPIVWLIRIKWWNYETKRTIQNLFMIEQRNTLCEPSLRHLLLLLLLLLQQQLVIVDGNQELGIEAEGHCVGVRERSKGIWYSILEGEKWSVGGSQSVCVEVSNLDIFSKRGPSQQRQKKREGSITDFRGWVC